MDIGISRVPYQGKGRIVGRRFRESARNWVRGLVKTLHEAPYDFCTACALATTHMPYLLRRQLDLCGTAYARDSMWQAAGNGGLNPRSQRKGSDMLVTVFRHVPPPIIGTVGVVQDRAFEALEEGLDWLEETGLRVERFDPVTAPAEVAARTPVRDLLSTEGERCLPLILVNDVVVLRGVYPSRTQLARAVGQARGGVPPRTGELDRDSVGGAPASH